MTHHEDLPRASRFTRRGFLAATGLAGLAAATGCGGTGGSGDGKVAFWKPPVGDLSFERSWNAARMKDFEAAHKGVDVSMLIVPWDSVITKYTAGYGGANPPDMAYEILPMMNKFRGTGALVDLKKIGGKKVDAYFDGVAEDVTSGASGKNGERYGVPFSAGHFGLTLNEKIWKQAGSPALPRTYEDLRDFAKKLTLDKEGRKLGESGFDAKNVAVYGLAWPAEPGIQQNYVWHHLWAYGADIVSKDGKDVGFDNPEGRQALQYMKSLTDSGATTPMNLHSDADAWNDLVLKGATALQWQANITPTAEKKYQDPYRVLDLPSGPAGTFVVGGAGYYAVASKSKNQKDAYAWLEYLLDEKQRKDYIRSIRVYPFGAIPKDYYKGVGDARVEAYLTACAAQTKYVRLTPVLPYEPQDYLLGKFNDYFLGRVGLEDMIKQASQQIQTMAKTAGN